MAALLLLDQYQSGKDMQEWEFAMKKESMGEKALSAPLDVLAADAEQAQETCPEPKNARKGKAKSDRTSDSKAELTKKELEAAERRYTEKVEELMERKAQLEGGVLLFYWDLGQFADESLTDPYKYGRQTAKRLAKDLGLSADTIRSYNRFSKEYTREQVENAVEKDLPWRAIQALLTLKDSGEREELEEKVAKGEITTDELRAKVKARNEEVRAKDESRGRKVDKRGGLHGTAAIRNMISLAEQMAKKIDQYEEAVKAMAEIKDEARKNEMVILQAQGQEALKSLCKKAEEALSV